MGERGAGLPRLGEAFAELLWPTRCVGCNMPGELLCDECRAKLPWIAQRWACPVCGAPFGWLTCTACDRSRARSDLVPHGDPSAPSGGFGADPLDRWPCRTSICAFPFTDVPASLIALLKDGHELRIAPIMAAAMACALDEAASWPAPDGAARYDAHALDAICFVPATAGAYARRGFDHMELVCHALSRELGLPLYDCLARGAARDQRALGREERAANLAGTVSALDDVAGLSLLLADDVITTGSSMAEAARALLARGAQSVTACAFARVW